VDRIGCVPPFLLGCVFCVDLNVPLGIEVVGELGRVANPLDLSTLVG
jgi:hypothetical protein